MPKTKQTRSPNQQQQWAAVRLLRNENTSEGSASIPTETKKAPKSKSSQRKDRINVLLDDLTAANTLERERLAKIREHEAALVKRKRDKEAARAQKAAEQAAAIASATLVTDRAVIAKMTVEKLVEQLAILRQWDNSIRAKSFYKNKKDKYEALLAALARFEAPKDIPTSSSESLMDDGASGGGELEDDDYGEDDDELYH